MEWTENALEYLIRIRKMVGKEKKIIVPNTQEYLKLKTEHPELNLTIKGEENKGKIDELVLMAIEKANNKNKI